MKNNIIVLTLIFSAIVSCKNGNKTETKNITSKVIAVETPTNTSENESDRKTQKYTMDSFDWTKALVLKSKLISDLNEHNLSEDSVIVNFLSDYSALEKTYNDILGNLSNYDSLNTLAYSENGIVYQSAIDFKKKIENNGFSITYSEGTIYISKNTSFIKSEILSLISPLSKEFLGLYCNEIDTICCDDASIIISQKTLAERILKWGEIIDKSSGLKFTKIAESEFKDNLYLLYTGQENTPSFDRDSKQFNQEALIQMREIIAEYPNSKASKEFKNFLDLLESEDLKETEIISQFLKDKFSAYYNNAL
jgi:hypothetical protein